MNENKLCYLKQTPYCHLIINNVIIQTKGMEMKLKPQKVIVFLR